MYKGGIILFVCFLSSVSFARDLDGRFAKSDLKEWFNGLRSENGNCCSDADGTAVADPDWYVANVDGKTKYRVKMEGVWTDVPDKALVTSPNKSGQAMVWPFTYYTNGQVEKVIRCFMPGILS